MSKIVIIDDNEAIVETLSFALEEEGHTVETFISAEEAIDKLPKIQPSTIFVDIFLPGTCGYELIKHIKKQLPNTNIIVMTGGYPPFDKEMCLHIAKEMGAISGLKKPFELQAAISLVS